MARKKKKSAKKRKIKWVLALQVASITVLLLVLTPYFNGSQPRSGYGVNLSKAVIIDGIALTKPNPKFIQGVKEILSQAGLEVDVYQGEKVTIELLRNISGYGLIILRVHSAIYKRYGFLYLFSAEKYSAYKYISEQIQGAVKEAYTFNENEGPYFALRADLLGDKGSLSGSVIILMGCNGTNSKHATNKLFERGVKAIIAWNGYVDLEYSDNLTLNLLKAVYEHGLSFKKAVEKLMNGYGPDPLWKSRLEYLTP